MAELLKCMNLSSDQRGEQLKISIRWFQALKNLRIELLDNSSNGRTLLKTVEFQLGLTEMQNHYQNFKLKQTYQFDRKLT